MTVQKVSLGSILTLERRPIKIDPQAQYAEIGIYSFGRGIFHKTPRSGLEVGDKQLNLVKEGDLIFQITFAWEGAVGLATAAEDGMYGSTRFPTFRVDERKCVPEYLLNYFRTQAGRNQLANISPGSAGRNRVLSLKRVPEISVPLPPLDEQRRIVARIEALAARIEEARGLRQRAVEEAEGLVTSTLHGLFSESYWERLALEELLKEDSLNGISIRPEDNPPGIPILRISAATSRSDAIIDESDFKYLVVNEQTLEKYSLEPGDLLACRFNGNLHFVGRIALYQGYQGQTHVYPDKLIRFRVNTSILLPEFARLAVNSPDGRAQIEKHCATTAGNIGISATKLKTIKVPVPSLEEQRRIVAYLDDLQARVDDLKRLQAATAAELDALLPSLLDRAFKGEL